MRRIICSINIVSQIIFASIDVTLQGITNPVALQGITNLVMLRGITNPVTLRGITNPVTLQGIANPVAAAACQAKPPSTQLSFTKADRWSPQ